MVKGLRVLGAVVGVALAAVGVVAGRAGAAASGPGQCAVCLTVPSTFYVVDGDGDNLRFVEVGIPMRVSVSLFSRVVARYDTQAGTASSPADFVAVDDGRVSIAAGESIGYARVLVRRTSLCQAGKHFDVVFSAPNQGRLEDPNSRVELRAPSCGS